MPVRQAHLISESAGNFFSDVDSSFPRDARHVNRELVKRNSTENRTHDVTAHEDDWIEIISWTHERGGGASLSALYTMGPFFYFAVVLGAGAGQSCAPRIGGRHVGDRRCDFRVAARHAPVLVRLTKRRANSTIIKSVYIFSAFAHDNEDVSARSISSAPRTTA